MQHRDPYRRPTVRRLRAYVFDPSLAVSHDTALINEVVLEVPWEYDAHEGSDWPLPGPVGEYLEVIDHDPASDAYYPPVDLNAPYLLASDGLAPTEEDPQFHQQMVYGVAMYTIRNFERALGRVALWSPRLVRDARGKVKSESFVRRLRVYPHALREANAYFDGEKKALLFGYFPATNGGGETVFTCLSYDIISHETTHALLDGVHPRFAEATNPDVHALHEAFADLVALLQRFTHREVVKHQIERTRGDLEGQHLLGQLAQGMGSALGHRGGLRSFIGRTDPDGVWRRRLPDPEILAETTEPHARGAVLVAAVFEAFLLIYKSRVADLLRIAASGRPTQASHELHPDLVERLTSEACKSAAHLLQMCIRAIDYCPPVDVTFSDYLRALVTADYDLHPEDEHLYRVAVIDAFRRWGIHPADTYGTSEGALLWPSGIEAVMEAGAMGGKRVRSRGAAEGRATEAIETLFVEDTSEDHYARRLWIGWDLDIDREQVHERTKRNARLFRKWLVDGPGNRFLEAFGLVLSPKVPASVFKKDGIPSLEIHSVRPAIRRGSRGRLSTELVVEITQRRRGYFDIERQREVDRMKGSPRDDGDFRFRRGCTVLIDPETLVVRRVIRTRGTILDDRELNRVRAFLSGTDAEPPNHFDAPDLDDSLTFARLHTETL